MTTPAKKDCKNIEQEEKFPTFTQKQYHALKRKILKLEKDNFDTIYILPCSGSKNWHELAENSALIYFYLVCQKLELKTKFQVDCYSAYEQYKIGYIRSLGVNKVKDNLKKVGLYKSATKLDNGIWVIKLNVTLNQEKLDKFLATEISRRTVQLVPVNSNNLDPKLYQHCLNFTKRINALCGAKLDRSRSMSRILGDKISELAVDVLREYNEVAFMPDITNTRLIEKFENIRKNIVSILIFIQIISELGMWSPDICASLAGPVCEAKEKVEKDLRTFIKRGNKKCNP